MFGFRRSTESTAFFLVLLCVSNLLKLFKVKVLYVRNLTATLTEEKLRETFEAYGKVDRVKKIKDYAFVHFEDRNQAVVALNALHR